MPITRQQAIEQKIANEERARKLAQYIDALEVADRLGAELDESNPVTVIVAKNDEVQVNAQEQKKLPRKTKIVELASDYLANTPAMHTREMLPKLEADGVVFATDKEKNKIIAISQALGGNDKFKTDRTNGWSLVDRQKGERPVDGPFMLQPSSVPGTQI